MSNPSTKNDQTKPTPGKTASKTVSNPASISSDDKRQGMGGRIEEPEGLSAEEELITRIAEEEKAASFKGMSEQEKTTLQRGESQEGMLSSDSIELTDEDIDTTQKQITDLSDRLARALAEVENTRRRLLREKQDALRYGASQLAMDVFEVADNLQRARSFVSEEAMEKDANLKNLVLGIEMTEKSLEEAFRRNQIIAIVPKTGEPFSAEHHQAVSQIENDDLADGAVIELLQRGYRMGDRLLRAAQVVTAKSKHKDNDKTDGNSEDEDSNDDATTAKEVSAPPDVAQEKPTGNQDK